MFTRTTGLLIFPIWLAAMGWLVTHDILPGVTADTPPVLRATPWLRNEGRRTQYRLDDADGRIGTIWTEYLIDETSLQRRDIVWIDRLMIDIVPLRAIVDSVFSIDGVLDEFTLRMANDNTRIRLHGERFHTAFSFSFEGTGLRSMTFKTPLSQAGLVTGAFTPLFPMADLKVGKRWRMQVFNPVAAITGFGDRFIPVLVEVTGSERLSTPEGAVECLVVESANTRAWIDGRGVVRMQEVDLPAIGTISITREPDFDSAAQARARMVRFGR